MASQKLTLISKLGFCMAGLFMIYLIIYTIACPSKELVCAVAFEVITFLLAVAWRLRAAARCSEAAREAILDELTEGSIVWKTARKFAKAALISILLCANLLIALDLTALFLLIHGDYKASRMIYMALPLYMVPDLHPALSAELLAGALIESNHIDQAQRLSDFLFDIRKSKYGGEHELVADMYGNYAIIALKKGEFVQAEAYCRRSIDLKRRTCGNVRLGNALTKLGNALREQGRYADAVTIYGEALSMREHEFGRNSDKVLETLREIKDCYSKAGNQTELMPISKRIAAVEHA
ncbi:MAG TPA: tetratricopeptide repeat protein, partial [Nitrososphaera sp.]|nr:tetratricopeptide repeat protein [Nitrososphaera sp.]